jgi:ATP-dependent Clp protease protease subunit
MIHQPLGGATGQATDIEIHATEIIKLKSKMTEILSHHTGQPIKKILEDIDRDYFMGAEEAQAYGLVDTVIKPMPKAEKKE